MGNDSDVRGGRETKLGRGWGASCYAVPSLGPFFYCPFFIYGPLVQVAILLGQYRLWTLMQSIVIH